MSPDRRSGAVLLDEYTDDPSQGIAACARADTDERIFDDK